MARTRWCFRRLRLLTRLELAQVFPKHLALVWVQQLRYGGLKRCGVFVLTHEVHCEVQSDRRNIRGRLDSAHLDFWRRLLLREQCRLAIITNFEHLRPRIWPFCGEVAVDQSELVLNFFHVAKNLTGPFELLVGHGHFHATAQVLLGIAKASELRVDHSPILNCLWPPLHGNESGASIQYSWCTECPPLSVWLVLLYSISK